MCTVYRIFYIPSQYDPFRRAFFFRKPLPTTFHDHKCYGVSFGLTSDVKTVAHLEGTELNTKDVGSGGVSSVGTIFASSNKDRQQLSIYWSRRTHRIDTAKRLISLKIKELCRIVSNSKGRNLKRKPSNILRNDDVFLVTRNFMRHVCVFFRTTHSKLPSIGSIQPNTGKHDTQVVWVFIIWLCLFSA